MGNNLTRELRKYYTRKGNRLIFSNGMTLNQLALAMWERLGYEGIDASVVSRVVGGSRLFLPRQLAVFCKILGIFGIKRVKLREFLFYDLCERYGIEPRFFLEKRDTFLSYAQDVVDKTTALRGRGLPGLALEWLDQLYEQSEFQFFTGDGNVSRDLASLNARILQERIRTTMEVGTPGAILKHTKFNSKRLAEVADYLKDTTFLGTSLSLMGDAFYITNDNLNAQDYLERSLKYLNSGVDFGISLRTLAVVSAKRKRHNTFEYSQKRIFETIDSYNPDIKCFALEGIARGQAYLGNETTARETMETAWKVLREIEKNGGDYAIHRNIQFVKAELEIASTLKTGQSANQLEKVVKHGLHLASQFGYKRYQRAIKRGFNQLVLISK